MARNIEEDEEESQPVGQRNADQYEYGLLPPGVKRVRGVGLVREIPATNNGRPYVRRKPVSLDLEEARKKRMDYFHPEFGWLIDGFKLERDRNVEDIMADRSVSSSERTMEV
jgi:hypothetical protein